MAQYRVPVLEQFSWQPTVASTLNTPPGSPVKGDRYLVGTVPTGAWVGKASNIAWYDGAAWQFDAPAAGWTVYNVALAYNLTYGGSTWTQVEGDMTKAVYDTNANGIVDKSENVDDGAGNASTAAQVKNAVTKAHTQGTDQYLDQGGANQISAAQAKEAYSREGSYDSGLKVILFNL